MEDSISHVPDRWDSEPRWPALVAIVAVGGIYMALPSELTIGPRWLFPGTVGVLTAVTVVSHIGKHHFLNRTFGFIVSGVVTAGMVGSLVLLIVALPAHKEPPKELLVSAAFLWFTNILVFALWYWRLDAGGPHGRDSRFGHPDGAFLFPQMTMPPVAKKLAGQHGWSPDFFDYLFLAFNTSTAFSPSDVPVLERWAKLLMMLQSLISLAVVVLLAAHAINIL